MRWFQRLFHRSRAERDLDRELRFHLERQISDNLAAGMSPTEARRDALLKLGGIDRVKEEVRDVRWETQLNNFFAMFVSQFAIYGETAASPSWAYWSWPWESAHRQQFFPS